MSCASRKPAPQIQEQDSGRVSSCNPPVFSPAAAGLFGKGTLSKEGISRCDVHSSPQAALALEMTHHP